MICWRARSFGFLPHRHITGDGMKKEKIYKKPLGQLKIEKFCSDNNNLIQNYISYLYKNTNYEIKLMTNKDAVTNRNSHCGAHICVTTAASNDYYYITTSRKDYLCQSFLTINENLLGLIKQATFNYKILLFDKGKIYRFDKWIFEDIKENENGFVNVPLDEAEDVYKFSNDDFRTPRKNVSINWRMLGYVRYSKKFDMHKKQITIVAPEYKYKRTFDSIVKAYAALTGAEIENGKVVGKPVENAAYKKSYKSFLRETNAGSLLLINDNGKTFKASVLFNVIQPVATEAPAEVSTSILVVDIKSTNIDVDIASDANENCNNGKVGGQRRLDKKLDIIADKLAEKETEKYTSAEIQKIVVSFGSNKNMLDVYILGLTDKGLHKEAAYAAKVFDALNNINFD